ncbi:pYEATS domain-containing protein [Paraglaciecola marina]|uniref:pYEATS domain-containing protein n=1 Tax=Paraglaciecola marina TaxID=2500157 RepID=UPI001414FA0B|nr:pYEATS domain-containing protein [Paraglaciecola marina]
MEHIFKLFEFLIIVSALIFAWNLLTFAKKSGSGFSFKVNEFVELSVEPSKVAFESGEVQKTELNTSQKLPADYVYLNHAAFLREHKQAEFQERTGLEGLPHYDIRVKLDSYYKGALDNVKYVEYFLHESYPEPIQSRSQRQNNFLLKELANGAYVLQAKVHLNDRHEPILLQRYITLNPDEYFNKT